MKSKLSFVCQECGYDTTSWLGRCPECGAWNSLKEVRLVAPAETPFGVKSSTPQNMTPKRLDEIKSQKKQRVLTGFSELDVVLGGGIVKGSVILLAGDPGIGKSTLLLQAALKISSSKEKVLYISGEESEEQIKLRADRIKTAKSYPNFKLASLPNTDLACQMVQDEKPTLVIIDSIQTMESENVSGLSGSVGQVRYAASQFIKLAKTLGIPIVMVGHVTKEGMVAGPMVLSHMVDVVLFLEGEKITATRILRSFKNRFGPVDEVGIFAMIDSGIKEVNSPEQIFLSKANDNGSSGSVLSVTLEGTRAFLIEIQALVLNSKLPIPRRVASGIDYKRFELLLAVLQKHCNIPLAGQDVFVNVAGGIKLSDPGTDLAICLAVISSFQNLKISHKVGIGEVGLLGELRKASLMEKRIKEAQKLGFKDILATNRYRTLREVMANLSK